MSAGIPLGTMPPQAPPPQGAPMAIPPRPQPQPQSAMSGMFALLAFLAGAGLDKTTGAITKIAKLASGGQTADPNRAHRGGIRLDAANNPGMTIAPQMAQMLAAKAGQQPSGSDDLVALLAKALGLQMAPQMPQGGSPLGKLG